MQKKAKLRSAPAGDGALVWSWHSATDDASSERTFPYYYECVIDAREHGYSVDPVFAEGATAPGGAAYSINGSKP